jgi:hypothetical protein
MSRYDIEWRLPKWTIFGNPPKSGMSVEDAEAAGCGYVVGNDRGKFWKLVGSGGSFAGIKQGLEEIASEGHGIFGAMDPRLAKILSKKLPAYLTPPPSIVKLMYPLITQMREFQGGGSWQGVNDDGTVNYDMGDDMGVKTKTFIGTKPFFKLIVEQAMGKIGIDPQMLSMAKFMPSAAVKMAQSKGLDIDEEGLTWLMDVLEEAPTAPATAGGPEEPAEIPGTPGVPGAELPNVPPQQ